MRATSSPGIRQPFPMRTALIRPCRIARRTLSGCHEIRRAKSPGSNNLNSVATRSSAPFFIHSPFASQRNMRSHSAALCAAAYLYHTGFRGVGRPKGEAKRRVRRSKRDRRQARAGSKQKRHEAEATWRRSKSDGSSRLWRVSSVFLATARLSTLPGLWRWRCRLFDLISS